MRFSLPRFGLPLLTRELTELSARKRTFLFRTVYAAAVTAIGIWSFQKWTGQFRPNSFEALGQGKSFFEQLVRWEFWGLYLFLPFMTCGAVTAEKERQTLQLLRITKLGSWTILIEKLASRLFAMGTFLLLPLPLAAMAYSLGGVEVEDVMKAAYVLSITALQVGSFSLLCSTWFQTTTGAMLGTYLGGGLALYYGSWLLRMILLAALQLGIENLPWPGLDDYQRQWFRESVQSNGDYQPLSGMWVLGYRDTSDFDLFTNTNYARMGSNWGILDPFSDDAETAGVLSRFAESLGLPLSIRLWFSQLVTASLTSVSLLDCVICSAPLVISGLICLFLARIFLWRRAEMKEWNFFESVLPIPNRCQPTWTRNPALRRSMFECFNRNLPTNAPIAWRETRRQFAGRSKRLGRMVILAEVVLVGWVIWQAIQHPIELSMSLSSAWIILWLLGCLTMTVVSAGLIPAERSYQTMDVLLATPLTAAEIVLQKLAGIRRIVILLSIPLLTVLGIQLGWTWYLLDGSQHETSGSSHASAMTPELLLICLGRGAAVPTYLALVGWLGFQSGLRLKNQLRAVLVALGILAMACLFPILIRVSIERLLPFVPTAIQPFLDTLHVLCNWISPCWMLFHSGREVGPLLPWFLNSDILPAFWFPLLFHFSFVVGMLWQVRRNALRHFSRFVDRTEPVTSRHLTIKTHEQAQLLDFDSAGPATGGNDFVEG